jgi:hypothetical protein
MKAEKLRSYLIDIERLLNVDLFTVTRLRKIYEPRIMVISFIRIELGIAFTVIGEAFEKDHSTIIYNVEAWHDLCETDKYFKQRSEKIFFALREFFKGKTIIESKEDPNEKVRDLRKIAERVNELQRIKNLTEIMLIAYFRTYENASISVIARSLLITSGTVSRKLQKHTRYMESVEYQKDFQDFCEMIAVKVVEISKIESWILNAGTL